MYIGAHVSIADGFDKCIDRIVKLGGNTLMTFASSPRSLATREFSDHEINQYLAKKTKFDIGPHYFHGVYLINLASENRNFLNASIKSLIFYQQFASRIGAVGTIFHIGSYRLRTFTESLSQIVHSINYILDSSPKGIKLILENSAGQGNTVGDRFEELSQIIDRIGDRSKIGVCLDTQHAFASGYQLTSVLEKFDKIIGAKYLSVVHLNDSLSDFDSHVDRHANLGEGKIGLENFEIFLKNLRLKTKNYPSLILEVPGTNRSGPRKSDIDLVKSLVV